MNYYCQNCHSKWEYGKPYFQESDNLPECPFCGCAGFTAKIPEFETPDQYKARTGKAWKGLVWYRVIGGRRCKWIVVEYTKMRSTENEGTWFELVCANPPPDDWGTKPVHCGG